jgi:hypothetical protein
MMGFFLLPAKKRLEKYIDKVSILDSCTIKMDQ